MNKNKENYVHARLTKLETLYLADVAHVLHIEKLVERIIMKESNTMKKEAIEQARKTIINTRVIEVKNIFTAVKNNIEYNVNSKSMTCVCTNRLNKKSVTLNKQQLMLLSASVKSKDVVAMKKTFNIVNTETELFSKLQCDSKAKKDSSIACDNTAYDSKYALLAILARIFNINIDIQVYNKASDSVDALAKSIKKSTTKVTKAKAKSKAKV